MNLKDLLSTFKDSVVEISLGNETRDFGSIPVSALISDSRKVSPGSLFVAYSGVSSRAENFIEQAMNHEPQVVVTDSEAVWNRRKEFESSLWIRVQDAREALAQMAAAWFGHPSQRLLMIGVTGTSGKTTTTFLVEAILRASGLKTGLIGTVFNQVGEKRVDSTHTTPGALELQELLNQMVQAGCQACVMEVSSHALDQKRVAGIAWDAVGFTNLSSEHLDYHVDLDSYRDAKLKLFDQCYRDSVSQGKNPARIIHVGDDRAEDFANRALQVNAGTRPAVLLRRSQVDGYQNLQNASHLVGQYNRENIALAAELTLSCGIAVSSVEKGIRTIPGVPGRLEQVPNTRGILVLVDYAHKPDALSKVLQTLQPERNKGRLFVVFGCGGDRDRTKRPEMGRIASLLADQVWVTSDNPRTENPEAIVAEVMAGIPSDCAQKCHAIVDRRLAITQALNAAQLGDVVLIAGKGHETYQIIGNVQHHLDDREVALEVLTSSFKNS
jgi:UDP-N-acetylmuramoyl-L-alanyl-D-glutamate--2,6-diaminopimelate ligase